MKSTTVKTFLMSVLMVGSFLQSAAAMNDENDNKEQYASTVKANWGQLTKYAFFGSTKLFLAYKLYIVATEGYDQFKNDRKEYEELRRASVKESKYVKHVLDTQNTKNLSGKLEKSNTSLCKVLDATSDESKLFEKDSWKNVLKWNNIVGSLVTFVGVMDLYNCFKIAKAMYNKEKTVRLEINFPMK